MKALPIFTAIGGMLSITHKYHGTADCNVATLIRYPTTNHLGYICCSRTQRHAGKNTPICLHAVANTVELQPEPCEGDTITPVHRELEQHNGIYGDVIYKDSTDYHTIPNQCSGSHTVRATCKDVVNNILDRRNAIECCENGNNLARSSDNQFFDQKRRVFKLIGWVKKLVVNREKTAVYMELVDGTAPYHVPVILRNSHKDYDKIHQIDVGDAITVVGNIETKASTHLKQERQLRIIVEDDAAGHSLVIHQKVRYRDTNPVTVNGVYPMAYLREHCNLRVRNSRVQAIFRIRSKLTKGLFNIFDDMGFVHVTTPTLTGMNCEGMGEVFMAVPTKAEEGTKAYDTFLSVSGQLELEALCSGMSRVWKLGPAFRADRSDTPRHLSEFWMIEAEMNDVTIKELIATINGIIRRSAEILLIECIDDIEVLETHSNDDIKGRLECLINNTIPTITYERAIELLNYAKETDHNLEHVSMTWGDPITAAHERSLIRIMQQPLVAITNYPDEIVPFYMERGERGTANNVDLIAEGVGEIAGGSLREVQYDILKRNMEQRNIVGNEYDKYLELRKFGNSPHAGFGIGMERLLMLLLRIQNIRDVIHFPKLRRKYSVE